jgi:alkanesulfonate monooxygenase SsuD/methylene tetrahydromethanopterin reductase-like flavin-dependent oxidoreductase (luciferase family)
MLRIVARYAESWNSFGTVDEMRERNAILDEHCAAIGRDPQTIVRSLYGWAAMMPADPWASVDAFEDMVGRYSEAGVNEFLIDQPRDEQFSMLERVAADLLPRLRAAAAPN